MTTFLSPFPRPTWFRFCLGFHFPFGPCCGSSAPWGQGLWLHSSPQCPYPSIKVGFWLPALRPGILGTKVGRGHKCENVLHLSRWGGPFMVLLCFPTSSKAGCMWIPSGRPSFSECILLKLKGPWGYSLVAPRDKGIRSSYSSAFHPPSLSPCLLSCSFLAPNSLPFSSFSFPSSFLSLFPPSFLLWI